MNELKKNIPNLKDTLYELYINQNLSSSLIAEKMNVKPHNIVQWLKKLNIKKSKEDIIKSKEITSIKKYGVKNIMQLKEVKEKKDKTTLKKYGVSNYSQTNEFKNNPNNFKYKFKNGKDNPAHNHNGKFSAYSKKFIKYNGLSDKEINEKIDEVKKTNSFALKNSLNIDTKLEYWINKGYSEKEAKEKLSKRQTTFSLEKCIKEYGEENGRKRWLERQEKWLKNYKKQNYSKISQKLFWSIYNRLDDETQKNCKFQELNIEHVIKCDKKILKPDFIILNSKKIIEFDGDYWHSEKRGNQQRDKDRDTTLTNEGYSICHIRERDYKNNIENTIQNCLEYIGG